MDHFSRGVPWVFRDGVAGDVVNDELEEGPDPNDVRRHAKRMYTEMQYRQKYRRIDFYRPNLKQLEFHNTVSRETMLRANNQGGKTHAAGAQVTMDALAMYPDWYEGRRFIEPPKIERPFEFLAWASCTTSTKTRDGAQTKLLGPIRDSDGMGTGLIPLDNIVGKPMMARGISEFVDSVTLRRETGGKGVIRFKTYEMGREAFQGEACDEIWVDEDISREDGSIYGECLARLTTTRGRILSSLTPLLGLSPLRKRFKLREGDTAEVVMGIWDCATSKGGHIPDEDIPGIIASYPEHERDARAFGADMQGEGAVFTIPLERIKTNMSPAEVPAHWPWIWGADFSHGGLSNSSHPAAFVLGAWDRSNDVVYILDGFKMQKALPINHVERIKQNPLWQAPVAWPHDGGTHTAEGITIARTYEKHGLNMMKKHATWDGGGYDFEAGIAEMENRFASGRLLVARHLGDFFDEYLGYHRDGGLVNKVDDDMLSATRVLIMGLRHAKTVDAVRQKFAYQTGEVQIAEGMDFDPFD
jgi:phage terminase large subunit-like protein